MISDHSMYAIKSETLRDEIALLLADRLDFSNTTLEFQEALEEEFGKLYNPDDINDEIEILFLENDVIEAMAPYSRMPSFLFGAIIPEDYGYH